MEKLSLVLIIDLKRVFVLFDIVNFKVLRQLFINKLDHREYFSWVILVHRSITLIKFNCQLTNGNYCYIYNCYQLPVIANLLFLDRSQEIFYIAKVHLSTT